MTRTNRMQTRFPLSRRELLQSSLLCASALSVASRRAYGAPGAAADSPGGGEPHFFIYANLFRGADASYLLDARPLALTAAGKMQNFTGKDPELWIGANGQKALMSSVAAPLKEFKDLISVVNGVTMSLGFDGHEQNQGFFLTGSPFGGASFIPALNAAAPLPLDAVVTTQLFGVYLSNDGSSLTLPDSKLALLGKAFANALPIDGSDPTTKFLLAAMDAAGTGTGALSTGAQAMKKGFAASASLSAQLKELKFDVPVTNYNTGVTTNPAVPVGLQLIEQFFKRGIARSIVYNIVGDYDTHENDQCKKQPKTFEGTANEIAALIKYLKTTPFDAASGKSLFDVTTVMIGAEFTRTMRQPFATSVETTGTDHNPLSNSLILFGKGIKGGQVIGEGDLRSVAADSGELQDVSGAHKQLDPQLIKVMGKPFDWDAQTSLAVLPESYDPEQYLSCGAIANTLLDLFEVSEADGPRRRFTAGGKIVPSLKALLAQS